MPPALSDLKTEGRLNECSHPLGTEQRHFTHLFSVGAGPATTSSETVAIS